MHESSRKNLQARSIAAQALGTIEPLTNGIVPPVHVTTTFLRDPDYGQGSGYSYGRPHNATVQQAEAVIAALEGASEALLLTSGMTAATAVVLALDPPAHILAPTVMYWAFREWLAGTAGRYGRTVTFVDMSDLDAVRRALEAKKTDLVWIETPSNPLWTITDIAEVAKLAHGFGALVAADSTVATPVFTQPLALGADIVMHSASKYLNGHSDVIAGALAVARAEHPVWQRIKSLRAQQGAILGPFEAWLLLRGLRTLDVRVRAATAAAQTLAERLQRHPGVAEVLYPGLPRHRGHDIAARQMAGFGAMLSIRVGRGAHAALAAAARVELWKRATSLGGVESLLEHRASVEGPNSPCPPDLLRLSVGLEDVEDLYADLDRALRAADP